MLCSLYADTRSGHDEKVVFQIENTRLCILFKPTLYGLLFNGVYWKEKSDSDSDPKSGGQWHIYEPSIEVDKLQKLMVLFDQALDPDPQISFLVKRDTFLPVTMAHFVANVLGPEFLRTSIYVSCCVLLELERRSRSDGISLTVYRQVLIDTATSFASHDEPRCFSGRGVTSIHEVEGDKGYASL